MGRTGRLVVLGVVGASLLVAVVSQLIALKDVEVPGAQTFDRLWGVCNGPNDATVPDGSCAEPLRGRDFSSGKASVGLELVATDGARGRRVDYTWVNQTARIRSFEWQELSIQATTGRRLTCRGDDTAVRYQARPGEVNRSGYGCTGAMEPGEYVATYDGTEVARITVPG